MKPICRAAAVRELDRRVIEDLGLPSLALMEVAVGGLAHAFRAAVPSGRVCVACGPGNNGGDGWALARWLLGWGYDVRVWPVVPPKSEDARTMASIARRAGVPECDALPDDAWVVDAVFGTGLSRTLEGAAAEATRQLAGRRVVALDLPSGLHADTGSWLGPSFDATHTLTLGRLKPGLFCGGGPMAAGRVELVDIGLDAVARPDDATAWLLEDHDIGWPVRAETDHKGRSGHLLVVAGSVAMAGAAVLVCEGALAAGAGLVTLVAPSEALPRLGALPPEVMVRTEALPEIEPGRYAAVVAGPGLGGGQRLADDVRATLARWWAEAPVPILFDADALTCTSPVAGVHPRVLTPHPGEAARLLGCRVADVEADRLAAVEALRDRGTVLLKGRYSLVADGRIVTVNPTGGPALATGGSGDVLAGIVGALLGRGVSAGDAARVGAWAHGAAGDRLWARRRGGWRASDVARVLPEVTELRIGFPRGPNFLDARPARREDEHMKRIISESRQATWRLGERLGAAAGPGTFVALAGDLGAGKTVFAKGLGAGLGVTGVISSPTFVLVALHESGRLPLWHVDAYRLGGAGEVDGLGLEEADEGVVVMEWALRFPDALPADRLEVAIRDVPGEPERRHVEITATGPRHRALEEVCGGR